MKKLFKFRLLAVAITSLGFSACGGLKAPGISTTVDNEPDALLFSAVPNRNLMSPYYNRISEAYTDSAGNAQRRDSYNLTKLIADDVHKITSTPLVGVSADASVPIKIVEVLELAKLEGVCPTNTSEPGTPVSGIFKYELMAPVTSDLEGTLGQSKAPTSADGVVTRGQVINLIVDLPNNQWDKCFRAKVSLGSHIINVMFDTVAEDRAFDPVVANILGADKRNTKPGKPIELNSFTFTGFNTRLPVTLSKSGLTDYLLEYRINATPDTPYTAYSGNSELILRQGNTLQLRITPPADRYASEFITRIDYGNSNYGLMGSDEISIKTHLQGYIPPAELSVQFPPPASAIGATEINIRGTASVTQDMVDFAGGEQQAGPVSSVEVYVDSDLADASPGSLLGVATPVAVNQPGLPKYTWEFTAPLANGTNNLKVVAKNTLGAQSEPIPLTVASQYGPGKFPANAPFMEKLWDLTIDARGQTATLFALDDFAATLTGNYKSAVWQYNLSGSTLPSVLYYNDTDARGIQFNNILPDTNLFMIAYSKWPITLHTYDSMRANTRPTQKQKAFTPQHPGHMAYALDGRRVFAAVSQEEADKPQGVQVVRWADGLSFNLQSLVTKQFVKTSSLDIFTINPNPIAPNEMILVLDKLDQNNTDVNNLWKIPVLNNYTDPTKSATKLTVVDKQGAPVIFKKAGAIAVEDSKKRALVADNGSGTIWEIDLTNIETATEVVATPFSSNAMFLNDPTLNLSSLVIEGDLPYALATDQTQNSIYAIDLKTGHRVFIVKTLNPTPVP